MIKKGISVTTIFIISTFIQLISQIVVTRTFGATVSLDIFLAAVALPTTLVTIIYGTLNDAFLPLYSEKKHKNLQEARDYFFSSLLILTVTSLLFALITGFFAYPISQWLYGSRGEVFVAQVAIQMFYMSFSLPLAVIATMFGVHFYAKKQFYRFPFAQLIGSIINLIFIVFLAPFMGIWSLIFAFVINIFFQILLVIPCDIFQFRFTRINVVPLLYLWVPLIIGSFALRMDTLLIRSFGSQLPAGYLVYLNLISKIFSLATSVMTIGIQILLLPHLVEFFAKKEYARAIQNVNKAKMIAIGVSTGVAIIVMLIAPVAIHLLFVGERFTQQDADLTISLIPFFLVPAIGWGVNGVFFQPLLALKKQLPLGIVHLLALGLGWLTSSTVQMIAGPVASITWGLIVLIFTGIIGSELLWQYYKRQFPSEKTL